MCCEDWNILIQDFTFFQKMIQEYYPAMPYFILGFSLGSFVVRKFALEHKDRINGMILNGTGYANPKLLDIVRVIMQREIKKHGAASKGPLVRSFAFGQYNVKFRPNHTEFDWLCSDLDVLDTYMLDDMCRKDISAGMFLCMLNLMKATETPDAFACGNLPILIASGDRDPVGENTKGVKKCVKLFQKNGTEDVELVVLEGRHDILREKNGEDFLNKILSWAERH